MQKTRTVLILGLALSFFFTPAVTYGLEARISGLSVNASTKALQVNFKVQDCFTRKMEEAILAGIPTTFTFLLELYRVRNRWFDESVISGETKHTIKYDSVKKVFYVTFNGNGRGPLEFTDFNSAKRAMEEVNSAVLASLGQLVKGERYYVKVKAKLDKVRLPLHMEYVLFFVSLWDFETRWERKDFVYQ